MTDDLPSITPGKRRTLEDIFRVSSISRASNTSYQTCVIASAGGDAATTGDGVDGLLPPLQSRRDTKKVDTAALLHSKFGANLDVSTIDRVKSVIPSFESKLNVNHQHYEQWARVPTKRSNNTVLFRGIQQLKARMKRDSDSIDKDNGELKLTHISMPVSTGDASENRFPPGLPFRREKTVPHSSTTEAGFRRSLSSIRNPVTPTPKMISADTIVLENNPKREKMAEIKLEAYSPRELTKHRLGMRDRCPFPVSVNQPPFVDGHVFFIHEPSTTVENIRSKTNQEFKADVNPRSENAPTDCTETSSVDVVQESVQRSRSFVRSSLTKKMTTARTPAVVSSAEVFDFSQLEYKRQSAEMKMFERHKTECSFSINTPKTFRYVPRVQRLRAMIK